MAEVLLVLTIIGVVAATAIPALLQNIQDQEFKAAWKKEYAVISNAYKLLVYEKGGTMNSYCANGSCMRDELSNYLNIQKKCNTSATQGCWNAPNTIKFPTGSLAGSPTNGPDTAMDFPGVVLSDGAFVLMRRWWLVCIPYPYTANLYPLCGDAIIDVNGAKGPAVVGRDIYTLYFTDIGTVPGGIPGSFHYGGYWGRSADYLYQ